MYNVQARIFLLHKIREKVIYSSTIHSSRNYLQIIPVDFFRLIMTKIIIWINIKLYNNQTYIWFVFCCVARILNYLHYRVWLGWINMKRMNEIYIMLRTNVYKFHYFHHFITYPCTEMTPQFEKKYFIPSHTHFLPESYHNNFTFTQFFFQNFLLTFTIVICFFVFSFQSHFPQPNTTLDILRGGEKNSYQCLIS